MAYDIQALQERFDDQSVTLRITKEANGDLNVRFEYRDSTLPNSQTRNV
jgi:hypothetical protein